MRFKVPEIGSNILRNKSALVVGIRATFTCFRENVAFCTKQEIASISITWNRGKSGDVHTYIYTYIHTYIQRVGATCLTRVVCAEGWGLVIFDWFILSMRKQVILDSPIRPPGFSPYMGAGR